MLARNETVLVVEDDDAVRKLVVRILSDAGYRVREARDGQEALEACSSRHRAAIDLLVADILTPQIAGPELADRLAGLLPPFHVLLMSAGFDPALAPGAGTHVHHPFIGKPFAPEELLRKVREVLGRG